MNRVTDTARPTRPVPGFLLLLCCAGAWAQSPTEEPVERDAAAPPLATGFELSSPGLPRVGNFDLPVSTRLALTGWSFATPRSALGLTLGVSTPQGMGLPGSGLDTVGGRSLDLGVHWRTTLDNNYRLDVAAWRRMTPATDAMSLINESRYANYGTSIEMQFTSKPSFGFLPEMRAIGLQLDSGGSLVLRSKGGRPAIYYRARF